MPQLLCITTKNKEMSRMYGVFTTFMSAKKMCESEGYGIPSIIGSAEYEHRSMDGTVIMGRRPIGPRRADAVRKRRI